MTWAEAFEVIFWFCCLKMTRKPDSFSWWSFPSWDLKVPWNQMQWTDKKFPPQKIQLGNICFMPLLQIKIKIREKQQWSLLGDEFRSEKMGKPNREVQRMCWENKEVSQMHNHFLEKFYFKVQKIGVAGHQLCKTVPAENKSINDKMLLLQIAGFTQRTNCMLSTSWIYICSPP